MKRLGEGENRLMLKWAGPKIGCSWLTLVCAKSGPLRGYACGGRDRGRQRKWSTQCSCMALVRHKPLIADSMHFEGVIHGNATRG